MAGPGFIPVPDVMKITLRYLRDNQQIENVLYAHMPGGVNDTNLQDVAEAASTYMTSGTGLLALFAGNVIWQGTTTRDLTSDSGRSTDSNIGAGTAGGVGAPFLPNNVSYSIHKVAVTGGRHNKGRFYVPGLSTSMLTGPNTVNAGVASDWAIRLGGLKVAIEAVDSAEVGFVSYRNNNAWLTEGVFVPITSFQARDLILDSQRRRLPGRGI